MKITSWRIIHKRHAKEAFSGEGAKLYGGRWNPPGYPAVYTADSLSLAMLELIVHLEGDEDLQNYVTITAEFDEILVTVLPRGKLPRNWSSLPISNQTQEIGKTWLQKGKSIILKVPSSVVPNDGNFVINPLHPDFAKIKIGSPQPLKIDPRVANRLI